MYCFVVKCNEKKCYNYVENKFVCLIIIVLLLWVSKNSVCIYIMIFRFWWKIGWIKYKSILKIVFFLNIDVFGNYNIGF